MKLFTALFRALDESNKTNDKVAALVSYLDAAPPEDAAWAIQFLSGSRPKRPVNTTKLSMWARELSGLPEWLFSESYDAIGDLAETLAILVPTSKETAERVDRPLHVYVETYIVGLYGKEEGEQREAIEAVWRELDFGERFVFNKLITGAFRVGVSQELVVRAISQVTGHSTNVISHRMMGHTEPTAAFVRGLYSEASGDVDATQPYPFCLAHPLEQDPTTLGDRDEWCAEWKWDGLRAQVIRRRGKTSIWSRGEDLMTDRFPEIAEIAGRLPDGTVLDAECLAWRGGTPMKFLELQRRIGRKVLGKKILSEVPVALVVFDLLEFEGRDLREAPLSERRALLKTVVERLSPPALVEGEELRDAVARNTRPAGDLSLTWVEPHLLIAEPLPQATWEELAEKRAGSRELNVEGLMLKRWDSIYRVGRKRGDWWKWKIEPMTVDAVLIYAQRGNGKRASLYTDYTFAVWDESSGERKLVPFAKAYSGLTDAEIRRVDAFVRKNTLEKFGPVRSVTPHLVFELGFEGIALSSRHKSGIAVRFPRILRWREDKPIEGADTLDTIKEMIRAEENPATATVAEEGSD